jgi:hypothetical protein
VEASVFLLRWLTLVALDVLLEIFLCWNLSSIADREIVILQIIVVLFRLWLTICKGDDEKIWLKLFQYFALVDDCWNNFIRCGFSQYHLFARVTFSENIISL